MYSEITKQTSPSNQPWNSCLTASRGPSPPCKKCSCEHLGLLLPAKLQWIILSSNATEEFLLVWSFRIEVCLMEVKNYFDFNQCPTWPCTASCDRGTCEGISLRSRSREEAVSKNTLVTSLALSFSTGTTLNPYKIIYYCTIWLKNNAWIWRCCCL